MFRIKIIRTINTLISSRVRKYKIRVLTFLYLIAGFPAFSGTKIVFQQVSFEETAVSNFEVLSKTYGYVRYFTPHADSENMDWVKFLMYGIKKIEKTTTSEQLIADLHDLFAPLCPGIVFSQDTILFKDNELFFPVFIRKHGGIGNLPGLFNKDYSSTVKVESPEDLPLTTFNYCFKIDQNIYLGIPMARTELPEKDASFNSLMKKVNKEKLKGFTFPFLRKISSQEKPAYFFADPYYQIADVLIRWNVVQHFYPYYYEDKLDQNWKLQSEKAIRAVAKSKNIADYYDELFHLFSYVHDSHIRIQPEFSNGIVGRYFRKYTLDIPFLLQSDTYWVMKDNPDSVPERIIRINGQPIESVIQYRMNHISASTRKRAEYDLSGGNLFLSFNKDSTAHLILENGQGQKREFFVNMIEQLDRVSRDFTQRFSDQTFYIDLCNDSCTYETFSKMIPEIASSKGIIFDLRGYPKNDDLSILAHFTENRLSSNHSEVPVRFFPDQQQVIFEPCPQWYIEPAHSPQSKKMNRRNDYKEPLPIHLDIPVIFLIDARTISFGETLAEIIKHHQIGLLVGDATAGCNGNATTVDMPFGSFVMTCYRVRNRDHSLHHGVGVLPDVSVIPGGMDRVLKKDIQLEKARLLLGNH